MAAVSFAFAVSVVVLKVVAVAATLAVDLFDSASLTT